MVGLAWLAARRRDGASAASSTRALLCTLLGLASAAACAGQAAPTELLCGMRTGESTSTLRVAAGTDPLAPASVKVGDSYEVRAVALGDAAGTDRVAQVVITVLDLEGGGGPVVLSQSRWPAAGGEVLEEGAAWRPSLSGWQRVYSPTLGRELAWGCALAGKGATHEGWARVDATGDSAHAAARVPGFARVNASAATVRLAWMGDVMLADGPGRTIARGRDPFSSVTQDLKAADLRIANLECVIATGGTRAVKPWTFRARPRVLDALRRHVDVVSLANNHSGDFGPDAFAQMLGRLQQAGLPYFGGGTDLRSAHQPAIIERQGLRIALLGYNEMFPRRFEAGPGRPGIAWADEEQIVADIRAARAQADIVIPYMHWGQEHSDTSHARQRALARLMIRAGADAVVGTHPHVRQDTEIIDGKPVIYSLGNFVFDGFSDADNNTGSILWMTVTATGVKDWHLQSVHLDAAGTPHPVPVAVEKTAAGHLALNLASQREAPAHALTGAQGTR
jgi:poly-gamma-glutamate synthesis protein (capsule biosynthesis protein)